MGQSFLKHGHLLPIADSFPDREMTSDKLLCLNMIVKNEIVNLERCLSAVADHVACWVIGDTGSSDGTQKFITSFFARRRLPGELHSFPFHNFEQARNAALDCAAASKLSYDYLLLADADMELVVEDAGFRSRLEAPGYRLIQRTDSGLSYFNTRLTRRDSGARYHGVTHEYLDVPGGVEELRGVWYKDHATGANRVDKFERDIRLLTEALKQEPENHATGSTWPSPIAMPDAPPKRSRPTRSARRWGAGKRRPGMRASRRRGACDGSGMKAASCARH